VDDHVTLRGLKNEQCHGRNGIILEVSRRKYAVQVGPVEDELRVRVHSINAVKVCECVCLRLNICSNYDVTDSPGEVVLRTTLSAAAEVVVESDDYLEY